MPMTFPYDARDEAPWRHNPAIQLFGNRFFTDQTPMEYLAEFLLIAVSKKRFGGQEIFSECLPPRDILLNNRNSDRLNYAPKSRLNLKLFSFLGISRLDSRHNSHIRQYHYLTSEFRQLIDVFGEGTPDEVAQTLENLFLGFQGAGSGRTWCAQSFLPISKTFIAGETIWKANLARKNRPQTWDDLFNGSKYFDANQHLFFARGGEVLYLQLCNALRRKKEEIKAWLAEAKIVLRPEEADPEQLHELLEHALTDILNICPTTLNQIAELIDQGIESSTAEATDWQNGAEKFVPAGWCPESAWREGYLFAIDLLRICQAKLGIVDRIYLLETAFVIHVLRSLGMQSARINKDGCKNGTGYLCAFSAPSETRNTIKRVSQHSVKAMEKSIYKAIRDPEIKLTEKKGIAKQQQDADINYGNKLFLKLAKRIGLIIPRRGSGERFVLNEQILRFLVITTVPLGGQLTFETFKARIKTRFGMVFDTDGLIESAEQSGYGNGVYLPTDADYWLQDMLNAAGVLLQLSDSCAMVTNPDGK